MTEGTNITTYDKMWAEQAARYTERERLTSGVIMSARGGKLCVGEEELPGNQACAIILESAFENTYYPRKFDPTNMTPPTCYALGITPEDLDNMAPSPHMQVDLTYFVPQSSDCKSCRWHEWGSADTGQGKACQERRRLMLLPAGFYEQKPGSRDFDLQIFDDPKHFQTADMFMCKLPVLSVKNYSKYVHQIAQNFRRPPSGVITRVHIEPDVQAQFKYEFELIEELPDALTQVVMDRHDAALKQIMQGYQPPRDKTQQKPSDTRGGTREFGRR